MNTTKVYPRAGGATWASAALSYSLMGLSPRWRGNPATAPPANSRFRSIPALAGQPDEGIGELGDLSVYPRAGGATKPCPVC